MSSGIQVSVKPPMGGPAHSITADTQDTVGMLKQYLLALGVSTQPFSAFSFTQRGKPIANDIILAEIAAKPAENGNEPELPTLDLEIKLERLTFADVSLQLEQVRDAFGLSSIESTYVNAGATRLHEIKKGNKKHKKSTEDELLELAELPEEPSSVNLITTNGAGNVTLNVRTVSAPNPIIPKPAAADLSSSKWQPLCRSPQLKSRGILAIIYFRANNGKEWHYVATPDGFAHVPQLTNTTYAEPAKNTSYVPTSVQVIEQTHPATISAARKNAERIKQDPSSCVPVPQVSSVAPWLVKSDNGQSPNANVSSPQEESSLRDWNEDFQSSREVQTESFAEKIARDRALCKTASEFAAAASDGATKIVEGSVKALNPDEASETSKLYLHKGIFYTHGSDLATAYAGIDSAVGAEKAVKKGIKGVEQLMIHDEMGLCPVLTAVVDYCGRSLVAQAPVPGIFREGPLIVYGLSEDQAKVYYDEQVDDLLKNLATKLHLKKHPVNKEGLELQTSAEVHGARSTDGRLYIIDLHRLFVPDLLSPQAELNSLRAEAVSAYFAKNPEAPSSNPDVWMSTDKIPSDYVKNEFPKDIEAAKAVATFVRETLVPSFIDDVTSGRISDPVDGVQLTNLSHRNGVNMRSSGDLYSRAVAVKLQSLAAVVLEEAIARSLKYLLKSNFAKTDGVENMTLIVQAFISKLLTGDDQEFISSIKTRLESHFGFKLPAEWQSNLNRVSLLRLFALKCGSQLSNDFEVVAINPVMKYSFPGSPAAIEAMEAARISLESTVTSLIKNSEKESADSEKETEKDSDNITEKNSETNGETSASASNESQKDTKADVREEEVDAASQQELLDAVNQSLGILMQAVGIYTQVYGSSHSEVAHALNKVATLFFEYSNDIGKAIEYSRKAITIAERVSGIDNYDVIVMYNNLAYFEHAAGNLGTSLAISQRVISLYNEIAWPGYKDYAAVYSSVGSMLSQSGKRKSQEAALSWSQRAVNLSKQTVAGATGNTLFQLAQAQIVQQDYKNASRSMEAAYKIFKAKNGPEDSNTKEVKAYLEQSSKVTVSSAHANLNPAAHVAESQSSKKRNKKKKSKSKAKTVAVASA